MTQHLSFNELVARLDNELPSPRLEHLDACAVCRGEMADLQASFSQLQAAGAVPEPSPLFWDHLSERVRLATAEVPAAARVPWWRGFAALGAVAAFVFVAVMSHGTPTVPVDRARIDAVSPIEVNDDAPWTAMAQMASTLSSDDVRMVVGATPEGLGVGDLTPKEREAFVRLLSMDVGGQQ